MEKTKKIKALKENHLFQKVYKKGKSVASGTMVLYALKNYDRRNTLVGITVIKNRGNAVTRNRIRRKIKEAYRTLHPFVKEGFLIVIVARKACDDAHFTVIQDELYALLKKAALLREEGLK
ncbi:MAG: ribonuclease P protein component [Firmicutes bacterium HGW-Firmicutes-21]|nr:MAG: ribonuclease P protein component [Firmicutes bacterium HGW-Firmicutes-21]